MADRDTGFLEGDRQGRSHDGRLLAWAAVFLALQRRRVAMGLVFILMAIGLELSMPLITRTAVDRYLVPFHVCVTPAKVPQDLKPDLDAALSGGEVLAGDGGRYLPERHWRRLDPALMARLRQAGAVDPTRWHAAAASSETIQMAARYPDLFVRAGCHWLIADEDLRRLSAQDLRRLRRDDARGLILMALLFCAAAGATLAVSFFHTLVLERAGQQMTMDLRTSLYKSILGRSLLFFARNPVGKLVTRMNNDVQGIGDLFRNLMTGLFKDVLLFGGICAVMFAMNVRLAAACMLIVPIMAALSIFFARTARGIFRRLKGYTGQLNTRLQETLAGMTAVKLLGAELAVLDKLMDLNTRHFNAGLAQVKMFAVFTPLMELAGSLAVALIIWHGGGAVLRDRLSLGTLVAFISYMQMLLVPIRDLSEKYNQFQGALAGVERILAVMKDPRDISGSFPESGPKEPLAGNERTDITFQAVDFGYAPDRPVFKGFDLTIPEGQSVTLVGPSGGGKSTLVNLLMRLYKPEAGQILLGGRDLKSVSYRELSRRIALVSQEMILLAADIRENITLDRRDISPGMLADAVRISGVGSWLGALTDGLHTRIGEGGRPLSQGQYQMLSLARALAGDPRVLILDEAFSQIDPESEKRITAHLPVIMAGRTCITVAHRLSTARHSHRILVIRDGRIMEDGDHPTLMAARGVYADMVTIENIRHRNTR